jgi:hypothetical protein
MPDRHTLALSFLSTYFLLPDTSAVLMLCLAMLVSFIPLKAKKRRDVSLGEDLLAAWAYERLASKRDRQSILARLSGGEVATLLEACTTLQGIAHCTPARLPEENIEDWIVRRLRGQRLEILKEGKDIESVGRLMRAIESDYPRLLKGPEAVEECRRLCWSRPEIVIRSLRDWSRRPDALQRFQQSVRSEPRRMERLITRYHQELERPGLSPTEEVSIFLQLQDPQLFEILKAELGELHPLTPTEADNHFVAEKFVTRLWSILAAEQLVNKG